MKPDFLCNFQTTPHLLFLMNSENKSLLIFKSLKQDIDLNAKLEKNHDFYFFISGEIKEFFLLHYLLPENTTDIWPQKMWYRVHHAWAEFQLTTLVAIGTDGIGSYKSNYHMIITATCKILTIKDLQQTSLWSWRLSIAISPFQVVPLLAVGRSDIFQFYLHNGKFCNSVLHLKTAAVTMH